MLEQRTAEQSAIRKHTKQPDIQQYINGRFVESESGARFVNHSPFTNEVINHVSKGSKMEIDKAVAAAKKHLKKGLGEK